MTGDQQQGGGGDHFHPGHLPVLAVLGDQRGEHVVAGCGAALVDERGQILRQFGTGLLGDAAPLARVLVRVRVETGGDGVGPGVEERLVLARNPEQPTDHGHGEGVREVVDDVDLVAVPETVDEVGDDPGQFAAHVVDAPGVSGGPNGRIVIRRSRSCSGGSSLRKAGGRAEASSSSRRVPAAPGRGCGRPS